MTLPSERLVELGVALPPVAAPLASYVPAVRVGDLVFSSGQLPSVGGKLIASGKVGAEVTPETAVECARAAGLNALAAVSAEAGGLDLIARIVKMTVFVASAPGFIGQPAVANGASDLLTAVFGDVVGKHARSALGVVALPLDAPVEVELTVAVNAIPPLQG